MMNNMIHLTNNQSSKTFCCIFLYIGFDSAILSSRTLKKNPIGMCWSWELGSMSMSCRLTDACHPSIPSESQNTTGLSPPVLVQRQVSVYRWLLSYTLFWPCLPIHFPLPPVLAQSVWVWVLSHLCGADYPELPNFHTSTIYFMCKQFQTIT